MYFQSLYDDVSQKLEIKKKNIQLIMGKSVYGNKWSEISDKKNNMTEWTNVVSSFAVCLPINGTMS